MTLAVTAPVRTTSSQAKTSEAKAIRSLDGLRGLAIVLVLFCHTYAFWQVAASMRDTAGSDTSAFIPTTGLDEALAYLHHIADRLLWSAAQNSASGVDLFFVLSGFLLFLPYARALATPAALNSTGQSNWPSAYTFYMRRARRILPGYYAALLTMVCIILVVQSRAVGSLTSAIAAYPWAQFPAALLLLFDWHRSSFDLFVVNNLYHDGFNGPLWSLAVEWQFYLVLPLLAWGLLWLRRRGSLRLVVAGLVVVLLSDLAVRAGAAWIHYSMGVADPADAPGILGPAFGLLFGIRGRFIAVFALGMLASLFYVWAVERQRVTEVQRRTLGWVLLSLSLVGLACASRWANIAGRYEGAEGFSWPSMVKHGYWAVSYIIVGEWLFGLCMAMLVVSVLLLPQSLGTIFSLRPLTAVGLISYSLYLWHYPLYFLNHHRGFPVPMLLLLVIIIAWSVVIYFAIERPFLRYRRKPTPTPPTPGVASEQLPHI